MSDLIKINEWYQQLIEDLQILNFRGIVQTKHAIGKRIIEDELKFGKPKYGNQTIDNLAKDLDVGKTDLYACVQFAKKYPEISDSVGKLSWRKITHKLLPESPHISSKKGLLIIAIHNNPSEEDILFHKCIVSRYRSRKNWYKPKKRQTVKDIINLYLKKNCIDCPSIKCSANIYVKSLKR